MRGLKGAPECEDSVITVAVDAGWGEDGGKAVQKLQGREPEGRAAGGIGLLQKVEDLVGAAAVVLSRLGEFDVTYVELHELWRSTAGR